MGGSSPACPSLLACFLPSGGLTRLGRGMSAASWGGQTSPLPPRSFRDLVMPAGAMNRTLSLSFRPPLYSALSRWCTSTTSCPPRCPSAASRPSSRRRQVGRGQWGGGGGKGERGGRGGDIRGSYINSLGCSFAAAPIHRDRVRGSNTLAMHMSTCFACFCPPPPPTPPTRVRRRGGADAMRTLIRLACF